MKVSRLLAATVVGSGALTVGSAVSAVAAPGGNGNGQGSAKAVSGTYSGTSTAEGPNSGPLLYNFALDGTYSAGYLGGSGTYSGHILLDYSNYTSTNRCANVSGTVTYVASGKSGSMTTSVDPSQSTVCEDWTSGTFNPNVHFTHLVETFTSGTGRMATATASSITSDGQSVGTSSPYADSGSLSGSVGS
jgi:hypothetical protein